VSWAGLADGSDVVNTLLNNLPLGLFCKNEIHMLWCFPDPFPDELLWSVATRYHARMNYPTVWQTRDDLFGVQQSRWLPTPDFCGHLQRLKNRLPDGCLLSMDTLVDNHTMLPFFAPFQTIQEYADMRQALIRRSDSAVYATIGLTYCLNRRPLFLRYCPFCNEGDEAEFGETYWHRQHQIPGVLVCLRHEVWLERSSVPYRRIIPIHNLMTARQGQVNVQPRPLMPWSQDDRLMVDLTTRATWLMEQPPASLNAGRLAALYRKLFDEGAAASSIVPRRGRRGRRGGLRFDGHFSPKLLGMFEQDMKVSPGVCVREAYDAQFLTKHPLDHLLIMSLLGLCPEICPVI
jgi:TniQ protein